MGRSGLTEKEIRAMIPAARARERKATRSEARAKSARYNAATRRIEVELKNGASFAFPITLAGLGLANATLSQLARVNVDPSGEGLHWPEIDADVSVPGVFERLLGTAHIMRVAARRAGSARSPRKAKSSRANGALGGRPRRRKATRQ